MAFLDFLGNSVNGTAQGAMQSGAAGVPMPGLTYGDILGAALKYGSKPGSSSSAFGNILQGAYGQGAMQNVQQLNAFQPLIDMSKKQNTDSSAGLGALVNWFTSLIGGL